jgi:formamidopyrimidine-DNA glycosylase
MKLYFIPKEYKMPESAECLLTSEYLNMTLANKAITDFIFYSGQYEEDYPKGYIDFYDSLPLLVQEVKCKGKLIYFICYNEYRKYYILHSLRMTGRWQEKRDIYCRWYIEIERKKKMWFRDPRCLATLHFSSSERAFLTILEKLGPDILSATFSLDMWRKLVLKYKNKNITAFLMDQNIISGCGNYLKAEVLYYAKISPMRKISSLTESESEKVYEALRIIPRISYNNKGLDFADQHGHKGFHEFHLKIYGKNFATRTKTPDGRTTYWYPSIQI